MMGILWAAESARADPMITGLPEMTPAELEFQNKHQKRVKKVKLNKIGLQRINENRKKNGRWALTEADVDIMPRGSEIEAAPGAAADNPDSTIPAEDMPAYVDNSQLKYFPPIRSQGSLPTCGSFSGTYYAMTYMWALANDLDAKSGGDDFRLSPKWNNNMLNGGTNSGTWYYWCYDIGMKHGTATWAEFPYDGDYREWCLVPSIWYDAIYRRFDSYGYVNDTDTDTGIEQVKQLLLNGYVLNIPTYINSWQWAAIKDDVSTPDDDAFVGKSIAFWVNGTSGYHAMTVVGYNDDIWTDINGNGTVDSGEKGAFRIANSWGTGWKEGGYSWMAYDALKGVSAVSGGPATGRIVGWSPARAHWVTARSHYEPQIVAEFTLEHAKRDQLRVTLGLSDIGQTQPSSSWSPQMISFDGGPYAFDGSTTPISGTFVFDFTDLANTASGQRWHLGLYDATSGDPVELYAYTLIDVADGETLVESPYVPQTNDAGQLYTYIDYDGNGSINQGPVADLEAFPQSGDAPLPVTFDASASIDVDGDIVSYHWDFGDGSTSSDTVVDHTYYSPGQFTAVLTVTDDAGASNTASVTITVNDPSILHAPLDLTAAATGNDITLSWNAAGDNADGYHIERALKYRGKYNYTRIDSVTADITSYEETVVEVGTYKYRVQAYSDSASVDPLSDYSNEATVTVSDVTEPDPTPDPVDPFPAPGDLSASVNGTSVVLTWTDNTSDETGFTIERGIKIIGKISYETIGQVAADESTFTDDNGTGTFYYRVRAFKPDAESDYSNEITVRIK